MFIIYKKQNENKEIVKRLKTINSVIRQYPIECQKIADEMGIEPEQVAGEILFWEQE